MPSIETLRRRSRLLPIFTAACIVAGGFLPTLDAQPNPAQYAVDRAFLAGGVGDREIQALARDPEGSIYMAGEIIRHELDFPGVTLETREVFLAKLSASGDLLFLRRFGKGNVSSLVLDREGTPYVAGHTDDPGFSATRVFTRDPSGGGASAQSRMAYVTKLAAGDGSVLFSVLLGGQGATLGYALAVDRLGAAYLTGSTSSSQLPVTANALRREGGGGRGLFGDPPESFVSKIGPGGNTLEYSTYLGGKTFSCVGGSGCVGITDSEAGRAIAVDNDGNAYVAGFTSALDFPTTPGAFQRECGGCSRHVGDVFVAKLNAQGSGLIFSTYLGGRVEGTSSFPGGGEQANAIVLAPDGSVWIAGSSASATFPTSPNAFQPLFAGSGAVSPPPDGFVAHLSADGRHLLASTFLGGEGSDAIDAILLQDDGGILVAGSTTSAQFPVSPEGLARGSGFLASFDAQLSRIQASRFPDGVAGYRLVRDGGAGFWSTGFGDSLFHLEAIEDPDDVHILGVSNAAAGRARGGIAAGEIVSIFGKNIGPADPAVFTLDENGKFPTELGGSRVLIGGVAAPLLFAQEDQINAVAPFSLAGGGAVAVTVEAAGRRSGEVLLRASEAVPELFRLEDGLLAVTNQDGTVNGDENPAPAGSIISLYGTGMGKFDVAVEDGSTAGDALGRVLQQVKVYIGGVEAEVFYAGAAPAFVNGLVQLNVLVPGGFRFSGPQSVGVQVGSAVSTLGAVAIQVPAAN